MFKKIVKWRLKALHAFKSINFSPTLISTFSIQENVPSVRFAAAYQNLEQQAFCSSCLHACSIPDASVLYVEVCDLNTLLQNQSFLAWRVIVYQQAYSPFFFLPGPWFRNGTCRKQNHPAKVRVECKLSANYWRDLKISKHNFQQFSVCQQVSVLMYLNGFHVICRTSEIFFPECLCKTFIDCSKSLC